MSPRRIATVAAVLAVASIVAWALIELGPADRAPVAPIVMREHSERDPAQNPDEGRTDSEPSESGSGGDPSGGAEPPPAPPPPAGDDDEGGADADD